MKKLFLVSAAALSLFCLSGASIGSGGSPLNAILAADAPPQCCVKHEGCCPGSSCCPKGQHSEHVGCARSHR
jgi:hypothetical protein